MGGCLSVHALDLVSEPSPNMALQRTRRPSLRSGRSLRSLGSPLNARPLGVPSSRQPSSLVTGSSLFGSLSNRPPLGGE
jgi:hypothetical protein